MSKYNSNNLLLDVKNEYDINNNKSRSTFRTIGFSQEQEVSTRSNAWDTHECKLKQNCLDINFKNKGVQEAYDILNELTISDIIAYDGHKGIFRYFIQYHPKYKKYSTADSLPSSAKAHFSRFFKAKVSMNMLQLRKSAVEYANNLNKSNENSGGSSSGGSNSNSGGSSSSNNNNNDGNTTNNDGNSSGNITDNNGGNNLTDQTGGSIDDTTVITGERNTRGLYGDGEDAAILVDTTDKYTEESVNNAVYMMGNTDVYDFSTDNLEEMMDVPGFPDFESMEDHKTTILGLPPMYNPLTDPNGRVFAETTMTDLPLVYISPGKGIVNQKFNDNIIEGVLGNIADMANIDGFTTVRTAGKMQDMRALAFREDFKDYVKYVENLASIVYGMMGLKGHFQWNESLSMEIPDLVIQRSLIFYADKSTSVSDGFSNEYAESPLTQPISDASMLVRQYKQLMSKDTDISKINEAYSANDAATDTGGGGITGLINKMMMGAGRILNGSQILYPMMWQDSRMDRSYNLSFKFYSPYGNKEAIFQYVYLPVICLLALTLPRMDSITGYGQPFYVNINSPGWFESSLGVVQSLTMERGGDDRLWTVDNLPQEINVTLTIQDMYPTMSMTKNSTLMAFNLGLNSYFDCMAGIRTDKLNFITRNIAFLKSKMSKIHTTIDTTIPLLIGDGVRSFVHNILR